MKAFILNRHDLCKTLLTANLRIFRELRLLFKRNKEIKCLFMCSIKFSIHLIFFLMYFILLPCVSFFRCKWEWEYDRKCNLYYKECFIIVQSIFSSQLWESLKGLTALTLDLVKKNWFPFWFVTNSGKYLVFSLFHLMLSWTTKVMCADLRLCALYCFLVTCHMIFFIDSLRTEPFLCT